MFKPVAKLQLFNVETKSYEQPHFFTFVIQHCISCFQNCIFETTNTNYMSKRLLFFFVAAILLFNPKMTQAGFAVKKHATTQVQATTEISGAKTAAIANLNEFSKLSFSKKEQTSPLIARMIVSGWMGRLALLFGIIGFFAPLFSIAAVMFGLLGVGPYRQKKGLAIAGLVLGIVGILAVVLAGYTALPIF